MATGLDVAPASDASGGRHRSARRTATSKADKPGVRLDLEGVRALAVLGVVIYHLRPSWLPGGFAGVDVFFVLSGFFITGLLVRETQRSGRVDLWQFWGRRARRLLPASVLVLVVTLAVSAVVADTLDGIRFADDARYVAIFGVNWSLAKQGTNYLQDTDPSPFQHYWSLGVEEQFYLVWPVVVLLIALAMRRRWRNGTAAMLFAVVGLASVLSFLIAYRQTTTSQPYAYFATYARVWQLGAGAVLAIAAPTLGWLSLPVRALCRFAGVLIVLTFYALAPLKIVYPGAKAIVPILGVALIILAGLPRTDGGRLRARLDFIAQRRRAVVDRLVGQGPLASPVHAVRRSPGVLAVLGGYIVILAGYAVVASAASRATWLLWLPVAVIAVIFAAGAVRARRAAAADHASDPIGRGLASDPIGRGLASWTGQALGRYSYSWYLWHWPPLVLVPLYLNRPVGTRGVLLIGVGSLAVAVLSYHLLENPLRASRWLALRRGGRSLLLGAALIALGLGAAAGSTAYTHYQEGNSGITNAAGQRLVPQPAVAAAEVPRPTADGCEGGLHSLDGQKECRYLPDTGKGDVILVGDSHAVQWFPAVFKIAKERGWGLRVWTRASCPLAGVDKLGDPDQTNGCKAWHADVMKRLIQARPNLVINTGLSSRVNSLRDPATGKKVSKAAARALYERSLAANLARLRAAGIPVLVIRDNPTYLESGPKCVLKNDKHISRCSAPRALAIQATGDVQAAKDTPGVKLLDLTSHYCTATRCSQVIGRIMAYRDDNHLTQEMIMSLEPELAKAAEAAIVLR